MAYLRKTIVAVISVRGGNESKSWGLGGPSPLILEAAAMNHDLAEIL
jgi:hypothetical protein